MNLEFKDLFLHKIYIIVPEWKIIILLMGGFRPDTFFSGGVGTPSADG